MNVIALRSAMKLFKHKWRGNSWVRITNACIGMGKSPILTRVLIGLMTVEVVFQQLWILDMPTHPDEAVFLGVGKELLEGQTLYVETWDHKPPTIYLITAAIVRWSQLFGGSEVLWARVLILGFNLLSFGLILMLFRGEERGISLLIGLLFLWFNLYWQGGYFLAEPMVVSVFFLVWYWMSQASTSLLEWLMIGFVVGGMFWLKQMAIPLMIVVGLEVWKKQQSSVLLSFGGGVLTSMIVMGGWLWWFSDLSAGLNAIVWFNLLNYPPDPLSITMLKLPRIMAPAMIAIFISVIYLIKYRMISIGVGFVLLLPILLSRPYHHYWILILPLLIVSLNLHRPTTDQS